MKRRRSEHSGGSGDAISRAQRAILIAHGAKEAAGAAESTSQADKGPGTIFKTVDDAAIAALLYSRRRSIEDGNPIERHGVTVRLEFKLQDG